MKFYRFVARMPWYSVITIALLTGLGIGYLYIQKYDTGIYALLSSFLLTLQQGYVQMLDKLLEDMRDIMRYTQEINTLLNQKEDHGTQAPTIQP
jgi:hypothetical protein